MLFDPKWNNPTFKGVSLREFIAWLETKDPQEEYNYGNPYECATGQYLSSCGLPREQTEVQFINRDGARDGEWLWQIVSLISGPTTFGAALERARASLVAE